MGTATATPSVVSSGRHLAGWTLPAHRRRIRVPTYDRTRLAGAVLHLGLGGFHRSHQAVYFDELAHVSPTPRWGIIGVNLRRPDMRLALESQDHLYTVVERGPRGDSARIVGSVIGCLTAPEDPGAVLAALADPEVRLVTLTVTADGYGVDRVTGEFAPAADTLAAELANPGCPSTAYGYLVEGLARRRAAGVAPFTVLSCDNLPDNGACARTAVVSFARLRGDDALADWIDAHVSFPSSLVDRITPITATADRDLVASRFGVADAWPVMTEPFSQWIVEDDFCNERPPLDAVGVRFVDDVAPYKLVKSRLLNGGHCALGYLGALAGHRTTADVMGDPVFARYVRDVMHTEIAPLLPVPDGLDLDRYQRTLLERFANRSIADGLDRLCARGSTKLPSYLLPSIAEAAAQGRSHRLLTLAVAGWIVHMGGVDHLGRPVHVEDALEGVLQPEARRGAVEAILARQEIFGALGQHAGFRASVSGALADLRRDGARATVASYVLAERAAAA